MIVIIFLFVSRWLTRSFGSKHLKKGHFKSVPFYMKDDMHQNFKILGTDEYRVPAKKFGLMDFGYRRDIKFWVPMCTGYQPEKMFLVPLCTRYQPKNLRVAMGTGSRPEKKMARKNTEYQPNLDSCWPLVLILDFESFSKF